MYKLPPRLLSGTAVSAAGRLADMALTVLTIAVVTRSLSSTAGVGAYGAYETVFAFLAFLSVAADGGLAMVFVRMASAEEPREEGRLLRVTLELRLLLFLGTAAVAAPLLGFLPYSAEVRWGILIGSVGIGSQLLAAHVLGVFQKRLRMLVPALGGIAGKAATLALCGAGAALSGGPLFFVAAFVAGMAVNLGWNLVGVLRHLPSDSLLRTRRAKGEWTAIFQEAWPIGAMTICWMAVARADSLLLSFLRPPEDLGWYALPYKVMENLLFFPTMLGGMLLPSLSKTIMKREQGEFRSSLTEATSLFLMIALPSVHGVAFSAPLIISILGGAAFGPSVAVLQVLAVAFGAICMGNLYVNAAIALGRQRILLASSAVIAALNIAVNLVVIPRYSFMGAAWTTLGTEFIASAACAAIVALEAPFRFWSGRTTRVLVSGLALLVTALLPIPYWARLVFGQTAYFGLLWGLGVLTPSRIAALLKAQRAAAEGPD